MDYYGLLFLYYLKGLSGKSVLRLFFNIEAGGTEQLLPENTSTPTTSPLLADIQYPDGLRTDQYFTYRETPTTVSNKARIKTIKGNTLKWNQLVRNGNFADLSSWLFTDYSTSVSDNTLTLTSSTTNQTANARQVGVNIPNGHKFIVLCDVKVSQPTFRIILRDSSNISNNFTDTLTLNTWVKYGKISATTLDVDRIYIYPNRDEVSGASCELKNLMVIDLTAMFGSTKADEIYAMEQEQSGSGVAYFRSLYPLPYYQYDSGSLLPFRGEGLKTVGKNLLEFDDNWESKTDHGITITNNHDGTITLNGTATATAIPIYNFADASLTSSTQNDNKKHLQNGTYKVIGLPSGVRLQLCESNASDVSATEATRLINGDVFTVTNEYKYNWFRINIANGSSFDNTVMSPMIMFEDVTDETFEPYTESTLSLPISTYFPNGMNGVNNVYDEWSEVKTIKRMDGYTFTGNETWAYSSSARFWQVQLSLANSAKTVGAEISSNGILLKFVNNYYARAYLDDNPSLSDSSAMNSIFSNGTQIVYELATPIETPITTEDANEALSLLMGKSVSSSNAKQMIDIITKGE